MNFRFVKRGLGRSSFIFLKLWEGLFGITLFQGFEEMWTTFPSVEGEAIDSWVSSLLWRAHACASFAGCVFPGPGTRIWYTGVGWGVASSHLCEWNQGCLNSSLTLALHSSGSVANSCSFLLLNSLDLCTETFPLTPWQENDHWNLVVDSKSLPPNMKTQLARRG